MDAGQTGRFIAELRKEKGWTQKELADRLSVTDKAVSRWETGKGLPDASLLEPLAAALGVSVGKLLAGKRLEPERLREETDHVIVDALRYSRRTVAGAAWGLLALAGVVLLLLPLVTASFSPLLALGPVLLAMAAALFVWRKRGERMKRKELFLYAAGMAFLALAFVLELLPIGAVLVFAPSPEERLRVTVSYFDLVAFGYANFAPLLTGILTVFCLAGGIPAFLNRRRAGRWRNALFVCTLVAVLLSVAPLAFGTDYMTSGSWGVTLCLALAAALQAMANRGGCAA